MSTSSTGKNLTVAAVALAFAAHIGSWMALGRDSLEKRVAETVGPELERAIASGRANGGCIPRQVVLESKTPNADALGPETLAFLASRCAELGVGFHPTPPLEDLGCTPDRCGDCLGYAQEIRFDTPFVAAAYTHYFRKDVYDHTEGYYYVWWLGRWTQITEPRYHGDS